MFDIVSVSPLKGIAYGGRFGNIQEGLRPRFSLRPVPNVSVCRIVSLSADEEMLKTHLKGVLGLIVPPAFGVFTAGTRVALRPETGLSCFIVTEGEVEGVLYNRLHAPLLGKCAVFDRSHGFVMLRFDGEGTEDLLSTGCKTNLNIDSYPAGYVNYVSFDGIQVMLHRSEVDRWFLYVPRSYAQVLYTWLVRICLPWGIQLYDVG